MLPTKWLKEKKRLSLLQRFSVLYARSFASSCFLLSNLWSGCSNLETQNVDIRILRSAFISKIGKTSCKDFALILKKCVNLKRIINVTAFESSLLSISWKWLGFFPWWIAIAENAMIYQGYPRLSLNKDRKKAWLAYGEECSSWPLGQK